MKKFEMILWLVVAIALFLSIFQWIGVETTANLLIDTGPWWTYVIEFNIAAILIAYLFFRKKRFGLEESISIIIIILIVTNLIYISWLLGHS